MRRSARSQNLRTMLVVAVAALSLVAMSGSAVATVNPRTFTLVVTPGTVAIGSSPTFTATVKNTGTYPLGSVNLKVPGPLVVGSVATSLGTWSRTGQTVKLRNLSLAPGASFTVTVGTTVKCDAYPSLAWGAAARQGNNFTGYTFTLKGVGSSKKLLIQGECSLGFVGDHQPSDAHPDDAITATAFDTGGDPVQVEILDGYGARATGISASIAMVIGNNPGGGTLDGTIPRVTGAGVASFDDLSIDKPGFNYTLVASALGLGDTTSDPFTVADLGVDCTPSVDCVGNLSDTTTSGMVNALADPSGPKLFMSMYAGGPDCADYTEQSSTLEFAVTSTRAKEITIGFDTGLNPYYVQPDDFQVCFESDTPFLDRFENLVTLGLLPDCDPYDDAVPPCVESRSADGSFVYVTFLAPAGDPRGRV